MWIKDKKSARDFDNFQLCYHILWVRKWHVLIRDILRPKNEILGLKRKFLNFTFYKYSTLILYYLSKVFLNQESPIKEIVYRSPALKSRGSYGNSALFL